MLALLGLATITCVLAATLSRRMSVLSALITFPVVAALIGGFGLRTGTFMVHGIQNVAGVAGMFIFAILYFGIMSDAGLLDPVVDGILQRAGSHPTRIVIGTALLALLAHLDGSGAVTFLITVPVMLPLYNRLGMDKRVLACAASLAAGVNFLPWTGPVIRAAASLNIPVMAIFRPLMVVQAAGLVFVFGSAWWLGRRETRRLGSVENPRGTFCRELGDGEKLLRRPKRFWINVVLTLAVIGGMIAARLDPVVAFMVGVVVALWVNYPDLTMQSQRINAHAHAALTMAAILFAAGAFTGILKESGMLAAMAKFTVSLAPHGFAPHLPFALGLASMPLSLLFDPDSFYFGVLPVFAETVRGTGIAPLQIAQAAILGMHTTGFPVSPLTPATFLLVGLAEIELRDHQKFTFPFLFAASVLMTGVAVVLRIFPI